MKTFSNMALPDLQLTVNSYEALISRIKVERHCLTHDNSYQEKFIELSKKMDRVIELKDAAQEELSTALVG